MYLDYEEYLSMGGTLDSTSFETLCPEAETLINYMTFNRLAGESYIPRQVKLLCIKLMDIMHNRHKVLSADQDHALIASQANDGVEIKYNTMTAADLLAASDKEIYCSVIRYLSGVRNSKNRLLTYRGIYCDE